jgi:hypothetical protein
MRASRGANPVRSAGLNVTGTLRGQEIGWTLARHSDNRLTLGVYTHVGLHDQTAAIAALPGPPTTARRIDARKQAG